jgi:hypothetical protein
MFLLVIIAVPSITVGQSEYSDYMLGEEKRLEIVVHALGEVQRPGEYRVPDNTTVLELLSRAGGGTEFANLSVVTITRAPQSGPDVIAGHHESNGTNGRGTNGTSGRDKERPHVIHINVKDYLSKGIDIDMPILAPGDVVSVPRNNFSKWKTAASIMRDLAVVVSTYLLYVKVVQQ